MKIRLDQIRRNNYRLIEVLEFGKVIPFVVKSIKRKGIASVFYFIINIISLVLVVALMINASISGDLTFWKIIQYTLIGIVSGTVLIIPVHESFHFLAYLCLGAKKIKFGADPEQLIFYVVADKFPINRLQLTILALTPFLAINLLTAIIILPHFPSGTLAGGFMLLSHNLMCIGDFAILNFALKKGNRTMITFDAVDKRKSYFFIRKLKNEE